MTSGMRVPAVSDEPNHNPSSLQDQKTVCTRGAVNGDAFGEGRNRAMVNKQLARWDRSGVSSSSCIEAWNSDCIWVLVNLGDKGKKALSTFGIHYLFRPVAILQAPRK